MKSIVPHITFNGDCEAAIEFYKDAFGGRIEFVQRYKGSAMEDRVPKEYLNKIMHSTFMAEGVTFMAADAVPGYERHGGGNIDLSIEFESKEKELEVFGKLSEGGEVSMPLQDTFWGAHFGMVKDRFGVNWMLNCSLDQN